LSWLDFFGYSDHLLNRSIDALTFWLAYIFYWRYLHHFPHRTPPPPGETCLLPKSLIKIKLSCLLGQLASLMKSSVSISLVCVSGGFIHSFSAGYITELTIAAFPHTYHPGVGLQSEFRHYVFTVLKGPKNPQLPMRVVVPMIVYLSRAKVNGNSIYNRGSNPYMVLFAGALATTVKVRLRPTSGNRQRSDYVPLRFCPFGRRNSEDGILTSIC
jgi:hypothetical protein